MSPSFLRERITSTGSGPFFSRLQKSAGSNDTMLFVSPDTWTMNPFEAAEDTTGKRFTVSFLEFMLGRIVEPDGD
jgi:hypothetical protein